MFIDFDAEAVSIYFLTQEDLEEKISESEELSNLVESKSFVPGPGKMLISYSSDFSIEEVFVVYPKEDTGNPKLYLELGGKLAKALKKNSYQVENLDADDFKNFAFGWGLGQYEFNQFKSKESETYIAELVVGEMQEEMQNLVDSCFMGRDLINTPANYMSPENLEEVFESLGEDYDAEITVVSGDELLEGDFPAIYAVGKGSDIEPRLLELRWGAEDAPKLTLVGKGVCFDSGGYNLKPSSGMRLMKKDMGGAATAIGLAKAVMEADLNINLRLLVPAVENMVNGNALKPGDVIETRKGLMVEIDNTDAEGRLVLCDALALACEEEPDLLIDFATLTGAARVALGQDLPAMFSNRDEWAKDYQKLSFECADPVWHMPLYQPYHSLLSSSVGDCQNSGNSFGGSITAALYLQKFVEENVNWMHLDLYGWCNENRPHGPRGGEAYCLRSLFAYLKNWAGD